MVVRTGTGRYAGRTGISRLGQGQRTLGVGVGAGGRVSRMWPESPSAAGDPGSGPGRVSGASARGPAWRAEAVGSRSRPHL